MDELPVTHRPLKILWTLPYFPWPTTSGGKLRQFHLLRQLSQRGHRITLLVQSKVMPSAEARRAVEEVVDRLIVLPRRSIKSPQTLLSAVFSAFPLLVSINAASHALRQAFEQLLDNEHWDVVQIEHSYGPQAFLRSLQQRKRDFILTEHNLESSLGGATHQRFPAWMGFFRRYDEWRYRQWERRIMSLPVRLMAVTDADAQMMKSMRGDSVDVVINGVDTNAFSVVKPALTSGRILFVGNFEYPPNRDAVTWFVEQVMPLVWLQMPAARFVVCGYAMPDIWQQRWPDARLIWRGFVDDLTQEQQSVAAFVAPLREGGGSKLKVLEALAAGLPLVSTRQGVSGLSLRAGEDFQCADTAQDMAQGLLTLLQDASLAQRMGEAGRQYVQRHHDWLIPAMRLEAIYWEILDAHRH